ncbi:hypothetical protein B0H16DRAFT_1764458 [Mycena metata]|uniref:Uncharacterized protein n=1 Tax=Mycena metata TaxID=1033252 RepID=A0AAD7MYB4_9AGAR|nr:hypothetical protein B0H16DRAFT_1764458 [Mycena metata]
MSFALVGSFLLAILLPSSISAAPAHVARNLLGVDLVTHISVSIPVGFWIPFHSTSIYALSVNFDAKGPLLLGLLIDRIHARADLNGTVSAEFTHTFHPALNLPFLGRIVNSGNISNVNLTQGATNTLGVVSSPVLDLIVDADVRLQFVGNPATGDIRVEANVPVT